jgi:hypothetical protein
MVLGESSDNSRARRQIQHQTFALTIIRVVRSLFNRISLAAFITLIPIIDEVSALFEIFRSCSSVYRRRSTVSLIRLPVSFLFVIADTIVWVVRIMGMAGLMIAAALHEGLFDYKITSALEDGTTISRWALRDVGHLETHPECMATASRLP